MSAADDRLAAAGRAHRRAARTLAYEAYDAEIEAAGDVYDAACAAAREKLDAARESVVRACPDPYEVVRYADYDNAFDGVLDADLAERAERRAAALDAEAEAESAP